MNHKSMSNLPIIFTNLKAIQAEDKIFEVIAQGLKMSFLNRGAFVGEIFQCSNMERWALYSPNTQFLIS